MKNLYFISFTTIDQDDSAIKHQVYRHAVSPQQAIANLKFSYRPRILRDINITQVPPAKEEHYQLSFINK